MEISISFKNFDILSFKMPLDPKLCHSQDVGLQLKGGNMIKVQLILIVTKKNKLINLIIYWGWIDYSHNIKYLLWKESLVQFIG
jgi:hypothetical protein